MSEFHISLTGHRPDKLFGYDLNHPGYKIMHDHLVQIIEEHLNTYDTVWVHSGMALGADTVWAVAARTAKQMFPGRVKFYAEIPVITQPTVWRSWADKKRWRELVDIADDKTVYADTYSPRVMQERNIGMIDHADLLLAIWDGSKGGTGNAVAYAQSIDKPIRIIDPSTFVPKD